MKSGIGRGDWRQFEPLAGRIVSGLMGPLPQYILRAARLAS